eukprot:NODE_2398_length_1128_cov_90.897127_g1993_i0.p2 GENE.NODE_2398_length_1128_cov_90.897127_g1993_i0~~NODE_2398_length_1128_cov_90.897127_g1993_i0.p2  ORF type:complete len:161 (+),score=43.80 NODE_2398_length_1128_cov_90.897127_g1993_i0:202-684(+)
MCGWLGATVRYLQLVFLCSYVQDIDDEEDVCVPFCADPGILRTLERLAALLRGCQEGTQAFEDAWLQLPLSLRLWAVSFFGWDKGYRPYLVALCAFVDQKTVAVWVSAHQEDYRKEELRESEQAAAVSTSSSSSSAEDEERAAEVPAEKPAALEESEEDP